MFAFRVSVRSGSVFCRFYSSQRGNLKELYTFNERDVSNRFVPKTEEEYLQCRKQSAQVMSPPNAKLLRLSLLGTSNAGKSTLINQLVGMKISPTSQKVHTTRTSVLGVFNEGSTQVEIIDTPGLARLKDCQAYHLEHTFVNHPSISAKSSDLIGVVVDASLPKYQKFLPLDVWKILNLNRDKKSILILNKVDKISEKRLLMTVADRLSGKCLEGRLVSSVVRTEGKKRPSRLSRRTGLCDTESEQQEDDMNIYDLKWTFFSRIFMISALTGDGVADLRNYLVSLSEPAPWKHSPSTVSIVNPKTLILSTIKSKALDVLKQEIPYKMKYYINLWEVDSLGTLHLSVDLVPSKSRHVSLAIGKSGLYTKKIQSLAREDLSNIFNCDVVLKIFVRDPFPEKLKK